MIVRTDQVPPSVAWEYGQTASAPAEHEGKADEEEDGNRDGCDGTSESCKSPASAARTNYDPRYHPPRCVAISIIIGVVILCARERSERQNDDSAPVEHRRRKVR